MKLSENSLSVLKNFSTINTGLYFKTGNKLRTVSPFKTVLAEATIDETVPSDFGIFDLNQVLAIISLHNEAPELSIDGKNLVIQGLGDRSKTTYRTCDATMIKTPPENNITLPSNDATFLLTEADLDWVTKAASALGSPNITVASQEGRLFLSASDSTDDSAHVNHLSVGPHTGAPVNFLFKAENWKMMPGTYAVTISQKGIAHFQNQARKIQYWVALEMRTK